MPRTREEDLEAYENGSVTAYGTSSVSGGMAGQTQWMEEWN
jgi:hypothetical protein